MIHAFLGCFSLFMKICSVLKAEQVVTRQLFYSLVTCAGVYKQREREDKFTFLALFGVANL